MGFFKIKLDYAPENTFENNCALKGWWIRWSNQYFPVIFSMILFVFCYLIVPVQYPGTTWRLSFRLNSPEVRCADSQGFKKPFGNCRASPSLPFPPLHLRGSGSAQLQALQKGSSVPAQPSPQTGAAKWDRKISNPLFLYSPELMSTRDDVSFHIFCSNG